MRARAEQGAASFHQRHVDKGRTAGLQGLNPKPVPASHKAGHVHTRARLERGEDGMVDAGPGPHVRVPPTPPLSGPAARP